MNIIDYAKQLLVSPNLEDKLLSPDVVDDFSGLVLDDKLSNIMPIRNSNICFSDKQIKFPKRNTLHLDERKGLALHFFANHELLAIEMMAAAILYLPVDPLYSKKIRQGLLTTIKDEQRHFKMYVKRMNDFSIDFGSFPINDYFWRQLQKVDTLSGYFSVVALTFESANLDFAKHYSQIFTEYDDTITAKIMDTVYQEEISHVALGAYWLNQWKSDKSLWQYYNDSLPDLLTPARAKGNSFDFSGRKKAGLDEDFINQIKKYKDSFNVTNRREWK